MPGDSHPKGRCWGVSRETLRNDARGQRVCADRTLALVLLRGGCTTGSKAHFARNGDWWRGDGSQSLHGSADA